MTFPIYKDLKAFIVYIEHNDRSAPLLEQLRVLQIPYEKVLSLSRFRDKAELQQLQKEEDLYKMTIGRNLLIPEIGAYIGHHFARLAFLKSNARIGLIMDDDARLEVDPIDQLLNLPGKANFCFSLSENIDGIPKFFPKNHHYLPLHFPSTMSAHAYLVSRKAAQKFVRSFVKYGVTSVADWPYPLPRVHFYVSKKNNFSQAVSNGSYSVADERNREQTIGTEHALTMPITILSVFRRIKRLSAYGFSLTDLLHHEIILRFKVRRYLAYRKLKRETSSLLVFRR